MDRSIITMTPKQALQVLAQATEPQMIGQITRDGFVQINQALVVLNQLVVASEPTDSETPLPNASKKK